MNEVTIVIRKRRKVIELWAYRGGKPCARIVVSREEIRHSEHGLLDWYRRELIVLSGIGPG